MTRKPKNAAASAASKASTTSAAAGGKVKSPQRGVAQQQAGPAVVRGRAAQPASKTAAVLAALQREKGATIEELVAATGWQAHSVRGFLSGTVRKKLALDLVNETTAKGRVYRVRTTPGRERAA